MNPISQKDLKPPMSFRSGNHQPFVVDGHIDLPYYLMTHGPHLDFARLESGPFTLKKAQTSGIRLFCCAIYCEDSYNGLQSQAHLEELLTFTLDRIHQIHLIKNRPELKLVLDDGDSLGTVLLLENADALAGDASITDELVERGVRILGLTHMGQNRLGDGNAVSHPGGLTVLGKKVLKYLEPMNLAIDCAHLHPKCFWQVLDHFQGLILTSHTGLQERCGVQRNIDLNQAGEIVQRDGIIGITFNPEMITASMKATPEDVFAHLDTVVQRFGPKWVGIGSDLCGFEHVIEGMEDITGIGFLLESMNAHGYDQSAIDGILGMNWIRIFKRIFL